MCCLRLLDGVLIQEVFPLYWYLCTRRHSPKDCNLYILRKQSIICVQVQRAVLDMTVTVWAEKGHEHLLNTKRELKPIHCHCRIVGVDIAKSFCEYQDNISAIKSDFLDRVKFIRLYERRSIRKLPRAIKILAPKLFF